MQALRANTPIHQSMLQASKHILKTDGAIGFFRGISAMALGAAPAHGIYFATYELSKTFLGRGDSVNPLVTSVSGALATTVSDFAQTPLDVIKQRLQLDAVQYRGSLLRCAAEVHRLEGLRAFWLSYPTTLVMNVPHHAAQFTLYEVAKSLLSGPLGVVVGHSPMAVHFTAGALAGGLAAALTTPLDVAKTRLQTQTETGRMYLTLRQTLVHVWRTEGMRGLLSGIGPRFWFHMPSTAICWTVYEFMKTTLHV
jgi:solute carrier family 25 iron transporter 28/37